MGDRVFTPAELQEAEAQALFDEVYSQHPCMQSISTVLANAPDRQEFVIDGALPARAVTLLMGQPDAGKTWLAYAAAIAVARGEDWLGISNDLVEPAPALIFNFDQPGTELGRRLKKMGARDDDPIAIHNADEVPLQYVFKLPEHAATLRALVLRYRAKLVVLDSLRECHTGDENSSKDMAPIMHLIRQLAQPTGAAVIVVHHTAKNADVGDLLRARGSSAIIAGVDAAISADNRVATWCKTRGWNMAPEDKHQPFEIIDREVRGRIVAEVVATEKPRPAATRKGKGS